MSVFNQEKYLEESIKSILSQTFRDFEFIVVNDACSDRSYEILKYWADKDSRIKIIANEENIGLTKSLNKAIKEARGEYVARQDADDISLPERLEKQVSFLDKHPEIKILGTFGYIIDENGKVLGGYRTSVSYANIKRDLIKKNPFMHTSVMIKKEIINKVGDYNEKFNVSQDYELWFRILRVAIGENLPLFLVKKRWHNDMISIKKDKEQIKNTIFFRKQAIEKGDYPKICYIYLLRPYLSSKLPIFLKIFIKKYLI